MEKICNLPPHRLSAFKFARAERLVSDYNAVTPLQLAVLVAPLPTFDVEPWDEAIVARFRKKVEEHEKLEVGRGSLKLMARIAGGGETGKQYDKMVVEEVSKKALNLWRRTEVENWEVEMPLVERERGETVWAEEENFQRMLRWRDEVPKMWGGIWAGLGYVGTGVGLEGEVLKRIKLEEKLEVGKYAMGFLQGIVKDVTAAEKRDSHPEFWKEPLPRYEVTPPLLEPITPIAQFTPHIKLEKPEPLKPAIDGVIQELEAAAFKSEALSPGSIEPLELIPSSIHASFPSYTPAAELRVTSPITPFPSSPQALSRRLEKGLFKPTITAEIPSEVSVPPYPLNKSDTVEEVEEDEESSPFLRRFFNRKIEKQISNFTAALEQEALVLADCTLRVTVPVISTPAVLAPWEAPEKHQGKWRGTLGLAKKKAYIDKMRLKWRPFGKKVVAFVNSVSLQNEMLEVVEKEEARSLFLTDEETRKAERDICEAIQQSLRLDDCEEEIELVPLTDMERAILKQKISREKAIGKPASGQSMLSVENTERPSDRLEARQKAINRNQLKNLLARKGLSSDRNNSRAGDRASESNVHSPDTFPLTLLNPSERKIQSERSVPSEMSDPSKGSIRPRSSSQAGKDIQKALEILLEGETQSTENIQPDRSTLTMNHLQPGENNSSGSTIQTEKSLDSIMLEGRQTSSCSLGKRKLLPRDSLSHLISSRAKRIRPSSSALTFDTSNSLSAFLGLRGNVHCNTPKPPMQAKAAPKPPSPDIQLVSSSLDLEEPLPIPKLSQSYTIAIPTTHLVPDHPLWITRALRQLSPLPNVVPRDFTYPIITPDLIISPTTAVVITETLLLTQIYVLPGQEDKSVHDHGFKVETNLVRAKIMHLLTFGFSTVYLLIVSRIMGEDDPAIRNVRHWAVDRNVADRVVVRMIARIEDLTVGLAEALARFGAPGNWAPMEETEKERQYIAQGWNPYYA